MAKTRKRLGTQAHGPSHAPREIPKPRDQDTQPLFEKLFAASPDAIVVADHEGRILKANPRVESLFGYACSELLGNLVEVLIPDRFKSVHPRHRSAYNDRPAVRPMGTGMELHGRRKDGSEFPVDIMISPVETAEGKLIIGVIRDITERKQAELARQETQTAFQMLADNIPQMVWMCTPDGLNTYFNQRWVEYTGLTLDESYGRGWNTPFHPDDKQRAWDAWNKSVSTGTEYRIECQLRAANGDYRWFLMRGLPLSDRFGEVAKWFGTCTDIDDLKRAEAAVKAGELRLDLALDSSQMGMWDLDLTNDTAIRNLQHDRIFGYQSLQSAWGSKIFLTHVVPEDRDAAERSFEVAFDSDEFSLECRIVWPDKTIHWIRAQGRAFRDEQGEPVRMMGTVANMTERKRMENELRQIASTDHLSGLGNHRCLVDAFEVEAKWFQRKGRIFSLLLIDLDNLKRLNDTHGHTVGSAAIRRLAEALRVECRSTDTATRYGGDEFAVILPDTNAEGAQHLADRLASRLANDAGDHPIKFSYGVGVCPHDGKTLNQLLASADSALYQMKRSKRRHHMTEPTTP